MQKNEISRTQKLVYLAMLAAIEIILTRFLSIQTPIVRIGFGFIPYILAAVLFGPLAGGIYGVATDLIGVMINPAGGGYFPGFSLSAFLGAFIYGLFLYSKPKTILRIAVPVVLSTVFVDLILNTVWISMLTGKGVYAIIMVRAVKEAVMIPVKIVTMCFVWKYVGNHVESFFLRKKDYFSAVTK